jgi:hypothetical protein
LRGNKYSIGEIVLVKDASSDFMIGKITKIVPQNGIKKYPYWPSIQVEWYYKKKEINREMNGLNDKRFSCISEFEVFKSNHRDIIFIETIIAKCQVFFLLIERY